MKIGCLLALPALASAHGIALPATEDYDEIKKSGLAVVEMIASTIGECGKEFVMCAPHLVQGWEKASECMLEHFEEVQSANSVSESCLDRVENIARHRPLALFASGKIDPENPDGTDGANDIGKRVNNGCDLDDDVLPYVWSYHLHIQWDPLCKECKETAMNFTDKFIGEFQPDAQMCRRMAFLTDLWNTNSIGRETPEDHHFADICKMATLPPGGPFLHSEKGFTLSTTMFHRALPWLMANRPSNDKLWMIVHPNTGCQFNDLRHWSLWVSPNIKMFYGILHGCVWASCEDQVLGCIAFNHLRPSQGYGQCFTPPTEFDLACHMTLGAGNTTTEVCERAKSALV